MHCTFSISHDGTTYELEAERTNEGTHLDTWRIHNRGDVNRFLILTNDRPALQAKHAYTARFKWNIMEGDLTYRRMVMQITTYLDYYIKGLWKPPTKGMNEKKAAAAKQQIKLF